MKVLMGSQEFSGDLAGKWWWDGGLEWSPMGECVCVCLSKEKRKKMKGRKEMAGWKREKGWCENEWWGIVGLGGARVVH